MTDRKYPTTFINQANGETVICEDITATETIDGVISVKVTRKRGDQEPFYLPKEDLSWILDSVAEKLVPNGFHNESTDKVNCIINYDILDTGWIIKKWFRYDLDKMQQWYEDLLKEYADWKWTYGKHKDMWQYDPHEKIGNHMMPDTSWIMLTWGDDRPGPVPWLRYIAKPEHDAFMPRNIDMPEYGFDDKDLGARECFKGYAREIIDSMPAGPHDIQVAIHTPGTKLPEHQDLPDKLRFHIPIYTEESARFHINGQDLHIPADGWVYLVNTSYLHSTDNQGLKDRVHIYGAVWTHMLLDLDLSSLETVL